MMNGKNDKSFIKDVMRFLDNVLTDFIENAPDNLRMQLIQLQEKEV